MPRQALFAGLVVDENDRPVGTAYVGEDPCYVVDDAGFRRHILAEQVDRAVLNMMREQIKGNENELGEQAAKMLGQDDIFSKAMLQNQLKNIAQQFEALMQVGIPEDARAYLGMAGFKIVINVHGEVVRFDQPTAIDGGDEGGDE
jgi:peptidyl-tRNA hydrolase